MIRACLYGRGACADFTLKSAALTKTNPTESGGGGGWRLYLLALHLVALSLSLSADLMSHRCGVLVSVCRRPNGGSCSWGRLDLLSIEDAAVAGMYGGVLALRLYRITHRKAAGHATHNLPRPAAAAETPPPAPNVLGVEFTGLDSPVAVGEHDGAVLRTPSPAGTAPIPPGGTPPPGRAPVVTQPLTDGRSPYRGRAVHPAGGAESGGAAKYGGDLYPAAGRGAERSGGGERAWLTAGAAAASS